MTVALAKRRRALSITASDRRMDAAARRRKKAIARWLKKLGKFYAEKYIARLRRKKRGPGFKLTKADSQAQLEAELARILTRFGLRDIGNAAQDMAGRLDGEWVVKPSLVDEILRQKRIAVRNIVGQTDTAARREIRAILEAAAKQEPQPSTAEIARRIRRVFSLQAHAFSPARAENIARTEAVQVENTGIAEGMSAALDDEDEVEWLAHGDGRSGDRHHERMNGKRITVKAMNGSDRSQWFLTPLGNRMRYPGDPTGPIREIARCRCALIPVVRKGRKKLGGGSKKPTDGVRDGTRQG